MGKVSSVKSTFRHGTNSGRLAVRFDERTVFIKTGVKNTVGTIWRIETVIPCSAKEEGALALGVQAGKKGAYMHFDQERVASCEIAWRLRVLARKIDHAAPCSPYASAARTTAPVFP